MIRFVDAFTQFVALHPDFSLSDKQEISQCLKQLLDADPEKEIMRRALEHYANQYNWPYEVRTTEGYRITGMNAQEATGIAQDALESSEKALANCLRSMYDGKVAAKTILDVQLIMTNRSA